MRSFPIGLFILALCGLEPALRAQEASSPFHKNEDGTVQFGAILIDPARRTVRFSAETRQVDMPLEYSLVGEGGKTHETLFVTTERPSDIHVAMLLIRQKDPDWEPLTAGQIVGDPVWIDVLWEDAEAGPIRRPLATLVHNEATDAPATPGPWIYNGSRILDSVFQAETDQVIFALFDDPFALVNNPREGHDNDELWRPRWDQLPQPGSTVTIEARRVPASE